MRGGDPGSPDQTLDPLHYSTLLESKVHSVFQEVTGIKHNSKIKNKTDPAAQQKAKETLPSGSVVVLEAFSPPRSL